MFYEQTLYSLRPPKGDQSSFFSFFFFLGGLPLGRVGGLGFKFVFIEDGSSRERMAVMLSWVCGFFVSLKGSLKRLVKGFEGGSVKSSSLANI